MEIEEKGLNGIHEGEQWGASQGQVWLEAGNAVTRENAVESW